MQQVARRNDGVSVASISAALAGFAAALFGVYWDDAWHTDRGRDDIASPPHLALYAGVTVAVAVVAWWGWGRRERGLRALSSGPIGMAVVGAAVTLASAPIDEWWHSAFGRDAVLWSPPHLLAVVGTVALGSGVALVAGTSLREQRGRVPAVVLVACGSGVVGGWQVLVLEYDTDVAQFSPIWYLPVLAVSLSSAALTVRAAAGHRVRWAAAWSGVAYTLVMIIVIAVLSATGFSTPIVPAGLLALVVADVGARRAWPVLLRSSVFVAALFVVYVPYLRAVPGGVAPSGAQAILGAALGVFAVAVTIVMFDPPRRRRPPPGLAIAAAALPLIAVIGLMPIGPAAAHDPGQGTEVFDVELIAEVSGESVDVVVVLEGASDAIEPVRVVARRAGRVLTGPLAGDAIRWSGSVNLDQEGRWFVYVEARRGDDRLEAWIPVIAGAVETTSTATALYLTSDDAGTTTAQLAAGVLLTLVALGILVRIAAAVRAASSTEVTQVKNAEQRS